MEPPRAPPLLPRAAALRPRPRPDQPAGPSRGLDRHSVACVSTAIGSAFICSKPQVATKSTEEVAVYIDALEEAAAEPTNAADGELCAFFMLCIQRVRDANCERELI